jgi:Fe-S-cluster-containing hydrogenase component 2
LPVGEGSSEMPIQFRKAWDAAMKGPVALVDCSERIPCNPCEEACRRGAIVVGENICDPPRYQPGKCDGCGRCVALCPGMAVSLLDRSGGDGKARVTVPYEMREDLAAGEEAWARDKEGNTLGKGKIVKVLGRGEAGRTKLVTIEVPEHCALKVKGVSGRKLMIEDPEEVEGSRREEDYPFCRCEEINASAVREMIDKGFRSLSALRRYSRVGLGFCQGRYCESMLRDELLAVNRREPGEADICRVRPPVRPVRLGRLGGEDD